jgi:16S rRNA (guanine527-N7)-methyltransferase
MPPEDEAFRQAAAGLGVQIDEGHLKLFRAYYGCLVNANRSFNLTTIVDYRDVLARHFLDSLTIAPLAAAGARLADVGSGAGFPGVPIAIARPDVQVTLIESTGKKAAFCEQLILLLGLSGARVVTARAEDAARNSAHRETYDLAVGRAVERMASLSELLLPFVRQGGLAVAMKKGNVQAEVIEAGPAIETLGGRIRGLAPVAASGLEDRVLVIIEKERPTPPEYPRRAGMPHKRPLGIPPGHRLRHNEADESPG